MCKQVVSAPVIFKLKDGTDCLAFYNNEDSIKATKLYILFPDTSIPKYIEGNDLYNLKNSIIHGITAEQGMALYSKSGRGNHKDSTIALIEKLILKASRISTEIEHAPKQSPHTIYNKKHACAWVVYKGASITCFVKDLKDKEASEVIVDEKIKYNVVFDSVYWAAGISSKDFTALKIKIREVTA